jgi:hypothetical protein
LTFARLFRFLFVSVCHSFCLVSVSLILSLPFALLQSFELLLLTWGSRHALTLPVLDGLRITGSIASNDKRFKISISMKITGKICEASS